MKKAFVIFLFISLLTFSLFAFPENSFSFGISVMAVKGLEEEKRDGIAVGGYLEDGLVFGEESTINFTTLLRTDVGYTIDESNLSGICCNYFNGAGVLIRPLGGLDINLSLGPRLFWAISKTPIFDITAGALASLSYSFGKERVIFLRSGVNCSYGFIFKSIYYSFHIGSGLRF